MTDPRWRIGCRDPFGRDRALSVVVDRDHILLVPPPGSAAVLDASQARFLGTVLDEAASRSRDFPPASE